MPPANDMLGCAGTRMISNVGGEGVTTSVAVTGACISTGVPPVGVVPVAVVPGHGAIDNCAVAGDIRNASSRTAGIGVSRSTTAIVSCAMGASAVMTGSGIRSTGAGVLYSAV